MKINHYNISHQGHLPIRVLQHNIVAQFEKTTAHFLSKALSTINEKGLKSEIAYTANRSSTNGEKVRGPFVYNKSKEINIQETFLAYLWCMTYSLYIYTDLITSETLEKDSERKELADRTFNYAMSLIDVYNDWDKSKIPNPEVYDSRFAGDIEKTNELFLYGFNFVMCHEFSHVELGHCEAYEKTAGFLTDLEKKEFEQQADANAVKLFQEGIYPENESATKYGVSIALSALMFFSSKVSKKIHPDSDVRIADALNGFQIDGDDTSWIISCAAVGLWASHFNIDLHWEEKNSFKSLFEHLMPQLD